MFLTERSNNKPSVRVIFCRNCAVRGKRYLNLIINVYTSPQSLHFASRILYSVSSTFLYTFSILLKAYIFTIYYSKLIKVFNVFMLYIPYCLKHYFNSSFIVYPTLTVNMIKEFVKGKHSFVTQINSPKQPKLALFSYNIILSLHFQLLYEFS